MSANRLRLAAEIEQAAAVRIEHPSDVGKNLTLSTDDMLLLVRCLRFSTWYATFRKLTPEELSFAMNFSAKVDRSRGATMKLSIGYLAKIADITRMAILYDTKRKEHERDK